MHERGHIELLHAGDLEWGPLPAAGWPVGVEAKVLSRDPADGALTALLRLPAAWRRPLGHVTASIDVFVLSGALRLGDGLHSLGFYGHLPAGANSSAWTAEGETILFYAARSGAPDFLPEAGRPALGAGLVAVDTETVPWTGSQIPGPAPGLVHKELRADPATGERMWISGIVPDWEYPRLEWHDVIEEIYCIAGDITLGNSGTMTAGSYLWRPPYVTHGPFHSENGCLILVWVDGQLVNHFVDDPSTSPEENRRAALRLAAGAADTAGRS